MGSEARFEAQVAQLRRPQAWGAQPNQPVDVRRTHISAVFLVADRAFKIKRPVDLGFLDFSTLQARKAACEAEVRLNRRLAPGIYLGVVPLIPGPDGLRLAREAPAAQAVEWAVEMVRLPDADSLQAALIRGEVPDRVLRSFGQRLAAFHARARRGPVISRMATAAAVQANAMENLDETVGQVGLTVSFRVHHRLRLATEAALVQLGALMDRRAADEVPCDTHGDLRAEHVYLRPHGPIAIDCIEFSDRYRFADPVSDVAFLVMDLEIRGFPHAARQFTEAWLQASADPDAPALLPFYTAYRSAIRAKVEGLALSVQGAGDRARARRHWLFALSTLEPPTRRPALLGIGGLPGTGKSTLATALARACGFRVIRSDAVRREDPAVGPAPFGQGAYSEAARDRVYTASLDRAEALLEEGERVILDASFGKERWRRALLDRARHLGVPGHLLLCELPAPVARQRLARRVGDLSDADPAIHAAAEAEWELPGPHTSDRTRTVSTLPPPDQVLTQAVRLLAELGLASPTARTG